LDPKAVIAILRDFMEEPPEVTRVEKGVPPSDVAKAIQTWASQINLPTDDQDTTADYYRIGGSEPSNSYLADFSGDDPDPFRATVLVRGGNVLGECVDVAS
jgi:hypothetical protein